MRPALVFEIASLLEKALPPERLAELLNELAMIEADPRYSDRDCEIGTRLCEQLCRRNPAAFALAQRA